MKASPLEHRASSLLSNAMIRRPKALASLGNSIDLSKLAQNFEDSGLGWFWSTDKDLRLTYISASVADCFGQALDELIGQPLSALFKLESLDDDQTERTLPFVLNTRSKFKEITVRAAQHEIDYCWAISGRPQLDSSNDFVGYLGSGTDVTASRRNHSDASRLAKFDSLTGLANRHQISQKLTTTLISYHAAKRNCALMMIDLDRFKQVNDTLGHQAGDELLKQVSQRLSRVVNKGWELGRIGGDEFQVILPDIDDRGQLGDAAQKMIDMVSQPYSIAGTRCVIGASIGIAVAPFDGIGSEDLIRSADLALYAAKNDGRGRYRFYSSDLHSEAEERRQLEDELRDALSRGEMWLAYQPVVATDTNMISGFEALLRWNHPERGQISPTIFIPIAEEANLIGPLGEWALRQACVDAASWAGSARIAVNVSPIQFANSGLPAIVASALANSGLAPERLELEITESVFLGEGADTDDMFIALKNLGVRLALDDFGTGYSSLGYLKKAPFDKIKIDQSFVRDATDSGNRNAAIITAIVSLADALEMETTAEGIETLDTLDLIRKLKVSHVQGYVYSKPLPLNEVLELLEKGDLEIKPSGPKMNRSDRRRLFLKVGLIHEDHRYEVTMRNLSKTGAMVEGLIDVPINTSFVIDFGEGQLAVATVKRSKNHRQGLEFEIPLISDGSDGLCTRHRISPYMLASAGMPLTALPPGSYPLVGNGFGAASGQQPRTLPQFSQLIAKTDTRRVA